MSWIRRLFGEERTPARENGAGHRERAPEAVAAAPKGAGGSGGGGRTAAPRSDRLPTDQDKYMVPQASATVEAYHQAVRAIVREKFLASGESWNEFVFGSANRLITAEDMKRVEQMLVDAGHRFDWSAMISVRERPEIYKPATGLTADLSEFSFNHPDAPTAAADADGRELVGVGDNVVRYPKNLIGVARYIRSTDMVLDYLKNGAPPDTIAVIDDSGGTLTAPILEQFKGVICAGGTVRSHLGILTREYGIPCVMNAKVKGLKNGDRVEIESSAQAKVATDYAKGVEVTARIWRLAK